MNNKAKILLDFWLGLSDENAHTPECIVTRAKLLLEQECGIKS